MRMRHGSMFVAAFSLAIAPGVAAQTPRVATSALRAAPPQGGSAHSGGRTTLYVGIATGEGYLDTGIAGSASFEFDIAGSPINIRVDPYIAFHDGHCGPSISCDANVLGVGGAASYDFPTARQASATWFVFGGLGLYRSSWSFATTYLGTDLSSTDLGVQLGGGARFGDRFTAEARWLDINYWSPLVLLFGWQIGS